VYNFCVKVIMSQLRCKLFISLLPGLGVLPLSGWSRSVRWAENLLCWVLMRLLGMVGAGLCLGLSPLIPKRNLVFTFTAFSEVPFLDVGRVWSVAILWTKSSLYLEVAAIFWLSLDWIKNMEWAIKICVKSGISLPVRTLSLLVVFGLDGYRIWSHWRK